MPGGFSDQQAKTSGGEQALRFGSGQHTPRRDRVLKWDIATKKHKIHKGVFVTFVLFCGYFPRISRDVAHSSATFRYRRTLSLPTTYGFGLLDARFADSG